jgi:hypothetical protein
VQVISPANQTVLSTQTPTADAAGEYTVNFDSSQPQIISLRVAVSGYLTRLLTNIDTVINSSTALTVPQLLAADFNNDGIINTLDYSLMNSNWNQNFAAADINKDGIINTLDFAILKNNWARVGE